MIRGLTSLDVAMRVSLGYTKPQAERRPGWWPARHPGPNGTWIEYMELRDDQGQLVDRMTMEDHLRTAAEDFRVRFGVPTGDTL